KINGVYAGFKTLKCMEHSTSQNQQSVPEDLFCLESTTTSEDVTTSGGTTFGDTTGSGPPALNGCWNLTLVKDGGSALEDGQHEVWIVEDGQLTQVWRSNSTGRVKQEFRSGPAIEADGAITDDMTGSVTN